jgi:hypothetical protein
MVISLAREEGVSAYRMPATGLTAVRQLDSVPL